MVWCHQYRVQRAEVPVGCERVSFVAGPPALHSTGSAHTRTYNICCPGIYRMMVDDSNRTQRAPTQWKLNRSCLLGL